MFVKVAGTHIKKSIKTGEAVLKAGIAVYPEETDKCYELHYIAMPIFPEEGYPGEVDKDTGEPLDWDDYNNWVASLPTQMQLNPSFTHFIMIDPNITKTALETKIQEIFTPDTLTSADAFLSTRGKDERTDFSRFRKLMAASDRLGDKIYLPKDYDAQLIIARANNDLKDIEDKLDSKGTELDIKPGTIDVGVANGATGSVDVSIYTRVNKTNPANAAGSITSVTYYIASKSGTADFYVGMLSGSGSPLTVRDSESLGDITTGSEQVASGLDIACETGDYIGCHDKNGATVIIRFTISGYDGYWSYTGECIDPTDSQNFGLSSVRCIYLYGEGEEAGAPVVVTPSTLSLTITTYAPTIAITDNQLVTPSTLALTLTTYAPTVTVNNIVTPPTLALTLTTYAPMVTIGVRVTPPTLALTLTTYAPTIAITDNKLVTPSTLALILTTYAPTVTAIDNKLVTPSTLALILTTYAPTVTAIDNKLVTPSTLALILTTYAPTVTVEHITVSVTTRIAFGSDPFAVTPSWDDISSHVLEIHIKRGRQHELGRFEAGTATIVLDNRSGDYWPYNAGGSYYPNIKPGKRLNIRVTSAGVTYDRYTGFIESWKHGWRSSAGGKVPIVTVECADLIKKLSRYKINDAVGYSQELSGARIGHVLDALGWPSADRDLDTGQSQMQATGALANVVAQEHIATVQLSELGIFFIAPNGDATFHDRHARLKSPFNTSQATFGDDPGEQKYRALEPSYDDQDIYNDIRITREGGTEQTAEDTDSQDDYGPSTLERTGLLMLLDTEAQDQANYLLSRFKDAVLRSKAIKIMPDADRANLYPIIFTLDISDRITLRLNQADIDEDYHIEGVKEDYMASSPIWTTQWQLSSADTEVFWAIGVPGFSEIGETTKVGY